jgi:hypothetical protein
MHKLRLLIAVIGSSIITITLITFMNDLVGGNYIRDPIKYLPVFNFIQSSPSDSRPRLTRPPSSEVRPDVPQLDYDLLATDDDASEVSDR